MYTFFILFITDYLLTYIGLYKGYIMEGNPFMVKFMSLNFIPGVLLRSLFALALCYLFFTIKKKDFILYKGLIRFAIAVFAMVMCLHVSWIMRIVTT